MAEYPYEKMNIQWFPGHMTKAQRMIEENLKLVDAVCEILDARIPRSSRNPDIDRLAGDKPRLLILNRIDLADPAVTARWRRSFEEQGLAVLETDARSGKGVKDFAPAVRRLLKDKLADYEAKGQVGRTLRVMILGIPNVGKSTFINKVAGRKAAIAGDKPGVTRGKQWINIDRGLDLLDTPGILWPKFDSQEVGEMLARGPHQRHQGGRAGQGDPGGQLHAASAGLLSPGADGAVQIQPRPRGQRLRAAGSGGEEAGLSRLPGGGGHRAHGQHPSGRISRRQAGPSESGAAG